MARKKKATKKRGAKPGARKKRTAARGPKRKVSKKRAAKRPVKRRSKPNGTRGVRLEVKAAGTVLGSKGHLYHAYLRSGREKVYLGHVVARTVTEAKRKAARCVRTHL